MALIVNYKTDNLDIKIICQAVYFVKCYIIIDFIKYLDFTLGNREDLENVDKILKMILCILLMIHVMAIIYHSVAVIDITVFESDETWINKAGIECKDP